MIDEAPAGYTYPFPLESDRYTFDDYWEDCLHFSTLMQQGDAPREFAVRYFEAHYPPEERAYRCLNLYWAIESFVDRQMAVAKPQEKLLNPPDRLRKAAWKFYSAQSQGAGITDDTALEAVANILQDEES